MTDKTVYIYATQIIFVGAILFGYQGLSVSNVNEWGTAVARYVFYILLIKGSHGLCSIGYSAIESKKAPDPKAIIFKRKHLIQLFLASIFVLLYNKQKLLEEDFLLWFIAHLVTEYIELDQSAPIITFGVGMACSHFEGYLTHVIPSDGATFVGFEENMDRYAAKHGVVFPVKKLFIIIAKSLYCPPDLKHFNKNNRDDLPYLEACQPPSQDPTAEPSGRLCSSKKAQIGHLGMVEKDVAGSKNRKYHNSVYKIHRPGKPAVYLAAECATPLHTLHNVMKKTALYDKLVKADVGLIVNDYCEMLATIIERSPECRGKCQLIYFDDTDPKQNLADILLDEIRKFEPNFENIRNE